MSEYIPDEMGSSILKGITELAALRAEVETWKEKALGLAEQSAERGNQLIALRAELAEEREEGALLYDAAQAVITTLDKANQYEAIRERLKKAAVNAAGPLTHFVRLSGVIHD